MHGLHVFPMQYNPTSQSELMIHCEQLFLMQKGAFFEQCDDFLHSIHDPVPSLQYGVAGFIFSHQASGEGRPLAQLSLLNNLPTESASKSLRWSSFSFLFFFLLSTGNSSMSR